MHNNNIIFELLSLVKEIFVFLCYIQNFMFQTCNADNEICCTVLVAPPPTPAPTQPPRPVQPQTTPCTDRNYGCVSPDQCNNGVTNGFQSKQPVRSSPYHNY